jgi:hypothetical protein
VLNFAFRLIQWNTQKKRKKNIQAMKTAFVLSRQNSMHPSDEKE